MKDSISKNTGLFYELYKVLQVFWDLLGNKRLCVFSPSYTTNYPLTAEFSKSCWFLPPQTHRRKKKINLMIRPRIFSLIKPLPSGIKLFFPQRYTDTPKNHILSTCLRSITISQICFTLLVIFSWNLSIKPIKENTQKKKKERLEGDLSKWNERPSLKMHVYATWALLPYNFNFIALMRGGRTPEHPSFMPWTTGLTYVSGMIQ